MSTIVGILRFMSMTSFMNVLRLICLMDESTIVGILRFMT